MMFTFLLLLYNMMLVISLVVGAPVIVTLVARREKYRRPFRRRLGWGLATLSREQGRPLIWIHALSAGEVASCRSLLIELRRQVPGAQLCLSATTKSGSEAAAGLGGLVDCLLPFPFDLPWTVAWFQRTLRPDLFILVETDFWPNFLSRLRRKKIPAVLVNGRISEGSVKWYRRFSFFFTPLFASFALLFMQRRMDAQAMAALGVPQDRTLCLGNLKGDSVLAGGPLAGMVLVRMDLGIPADAFCWVCGSTHAGEEEIILTVYERLRSDGGNLFLVLAPRDPRRGEAVAQLAAKRGLACRRRSDGEGSAGASILILDIMGELQQIYRLGDVAFVGGSLVNDGGHNILEPAAFGRPVLFGPHIQDFADLARDLTAAGGSVMAASGKELYQILRRWQHDPALRQTAGQCALNYLKEQEGAAQRIVARILPLLHL